MPKAKVTQAGSGLSNAVLAKVAHQELTRELGEAQADSHEGHLAICNGNNWPGDLLSNTSSVLQAEAMLVVLRAVGLPDEDGKEFAEWLQGAKSACADGFNKVLLEQQEDAVGDSLLGDWWLAQAKAYDAVLRKISDYK